MGRQETGGGDLAGIAKGSKVAIGISNLRDAQETPEEKMAFKDAPGENQLEVGN